MDKPLWTPSRDRIAASKLAEFIAFLEPRHGRMDADTLHAWSIAESATFWSELWNFAGVIGDKGPAPHFNAGAKFQDGAFFPNGHVNFAENILRFASEEQDIVFWGEDKVKLRTTSGQLKADSGKFQRALRSAGIIAADRVAAILPNLPQSIAAMLAATAMGAIWSSCSPDFGGRGILDRFGQIGPKVLVVCDGYYYAGKILPITDKIIEVVSQLPSVEHVYVVEYIGDAAATAAAIAKACPSVGVETWNDALAAGGAGELAFERLPFNHPLFILYSSGTTGAPKCIVHRAGGILLKHLSEHILHTDVKPRDRVFYFTTLGWMMWNWLVSGLGAGASLLLYDGSPTHPDTGILWRYAQTERCTHFGTSAKYIDSIKKAGLQPGKTHDLTQLRSVMSTGSPLSHEGFEYIYQAIKSDVHLASISGGTDICGCFILGHPMKPVYAGEIQARALGLAPDVTDDAGVHLSSGKGELVCRNAFPSMPLGFWNDADGSRYHNAYFARIPGLWHHGDFAEWTTHGGMIIHGRSDATLNPGGVRIGTAEIYRVLETIPQIQDSVCVGQPWQDDVRVLLFVVMKDGAKLTDDLVAHIKSRIRQGASPRHVPALVHAVDDIPRTRSGKISELAVRDTVMGIAIKNTEALANPQSLAQYTSGPWR